MAFVGTKEEVRGKPMTVREKLNPENSLTFCGKGLLPLEQVKEQVEMFAELMPEFMAS